tara:strand:+ start:440 stop:1807 length:1368 start_codon:yes stop_codon:yes gene_type:complete
MIRTLEKLQIFENLCINSEIISKNGNQLQPNEEDEIKRVYSSNGLPWWNEGKMTKSTYTFSLFKINNQIVGVSGIDHDDLEIRDDAVHKDYQNMGIYKRLMKHTNNWLKINKPGITYYLFTEKTGINSNDRKKILNHINAGLVLLDRSTERNSTYTSGINGKTYYSLEDNDYFVFRTPGNHNINFLNYRARGGGFAKCSGIYIGNGIILTADHCDRDGPDDFISPEISVNSLNFPFKPDGVTVRVKSEFIRYPGRTFGDENTTNDFAIIKLIPSSEANKFNQDMEVIPLLQDNLNIHGEAVFVDGDYPSYSDTRDYNSYGKNDLNIRQTKIIDFNVVRIEVDQENLSDNMRGDNMTETLNNFRSKLNCVRVTDGRPLDQGDSGGPHFHIKNDTNQIVYLGPTGTKPYPYCYEELTHGGDADVVISAVYQHRNFIKSNHPADLIIYNLSRDIFLFD